MAAAQEIRLAPISVAEAAPLLADAIAGRRDTGGGLLSVAELLRGTECFEVIAETGHRVGAYAVQVASHDNGSEAVIVAAVANLPGVDLTATILPVIEGQARAAGCEALTIYTRRRGLLAKLRAQGFGLGGYIMRKKI